MLRAVQGDETRSWALGRYKAAGFSPDEFAHLRPAREAMADALSRAEDLAETSRRIARADRDALRTVRRRLELELWP